MTPSPFPPNDPLEQRVTVSLLKINLALKSHSWQGAELQGLTPTQGQILALLRNQPEIDVRLSEVAEALAISAPTASEAVKTLVEKGLVKKQRSVQDGRAIILKLTPEGQEQAEQVSDWANFLQQAIQSLSQQEQEALFQGLVKVIKALQEQGQIPVTRMCVTCNYFQPNLYPDDIHPHHCNFVNAPFGNRDLRIDCPDHQAVILNENNADG